MAFAFFFPVSNTDSHYFDSAIYTQYTSKMMEKAKYTLHFSESIPSSIRLNISYKKVKDKNINYYTLLRN